MKKYVQIPTGHLSVDTGAESSDVALLITTLASEKMAIQNLRLVVEQADKVQTAWLLEEITRREQFAKQVLASLEQLSGH